MTKLLPDRLPARSALNPGDADINLVNPTAAEGKYVRVDYDYIRQFCRRLHGNAKDEQILGDHDDGIAKPHPDAIDLYLHIGMANGMDYVTVERQAYRQDFSSTWWDRWQRPSGRLYYTSPDETGKTVDDAGPCPWFDAKVPIGLAPDFDIDTIVGSAKKLLTAGVPFRRDKREPIELKSHIEAGNYGCGFIYYESLANRFVQQKRKNVLFCHVPGELDKVSLEKARDAIVAVIVSTAATPLP